MQEELKKEILTVEIIKKDVKGILIYNVLMMLFFTVLFFCFFISQYMYNGRYGICFVIKSGFNNYCNISCFKRSFFTSINLLHNIANNLPKRVF